MYYTQILTSDSNLIVSPSLIPKTFKFQCQFVFSQGESMKMKCLGIHENYIKYSKNKVLDIRNAAAQQIFHPLHDICGFKVKKSNQEFEIYGENEDFFRVMKRYIVQQDFYFTYEIGKLIRNENSKLVQSGVYEIRRKSNKMKGTAKIYDKRMMTVQQIAQIRREVYVLQHLSNKNVANLQEIYENQDQLILIFEYIKGRKLSQMVGKCLLLYEDIQTLAQTIINALFHLQQQKIQHNNLTSQNIIIPNTSDMRSAVIINFSEAELINTTNTTTDLRGLAQVISNLTQVNQCKSIVSDNFIRQIMNDNISLNQATRLPFISQQPIEIKSSEYFPKLKFIKASTYKSDKSIKLMSVKKRGSGSKILLPRIRLETFDRN